MLRREQNGLVTYHFDHLAAENLVHAVFSRLGGISQEAFATLNVGHTVGDDDKAVAENHRRIYAHLALSPERVATARQVHSNRVAVVGEEEAGRVLHNSDGLVTATPGLALMLRFADCQPILLYDPERHALGLIHAGWRGVAQGIARRAVEVMQAKFGSRPRALLAGLGPAIGPCCYTVGHEVAAAMGYALPDWSRVMHLEEGDAWRFDLPAANAQLLVAAGVRRIEQANLCTACHSDEFFSHRADNGETGRFAVVAFLGARSGDRETMATETACLDEPIAETGDVGTLHPPGFPGFGELPGGEP